VAKSWTGPIGRLGSRGARRWYGWLRLRPTATAALIYALLSLLLFSPALIPGRSLSASDVLERVAPWEATAPAGVPPFGSNFDLTDSAVQFQPFLQTTRAALPHVRLWNPYIMGGRPYVANAQSAVFSPLSAPAYVLPFWRSLALIAALKLFVATLGTYLLGRALGMRFGGSLLAGAVFGFSFWMVTWVSWPATSVWAYLPWVCLLAELVVRRPGSLPFAGLAAVVGLQYFGGHPESSFHVLAFATVFWVLRVLAARPLRAWAVAKRALAFFGALLAGTALAAVVLIPFLELLGHSADVHARLAGKPRHLPAQDLLGVFLHDYWGRETRVSLQFPFSALQEKAYYVGALTLMLALAALVLRPRWERLGLAAVAAGALAIVVGVQPFFALVTGLPAFGAAQNQRLGVFFVFCVALLAGWGLDDLSGRRIPPRRRRLLLRAACAALFVFPVVVMVAGGTLAPDTVGAAFRVAWGFAEPSPSAPDLSGLIHLASLLEWLVLAAAALALVLLRLRGRVGGAWFAALAVVLVVVDLFKADMGWNPAIPTGHAQPPATGAIRYLQARRPERFVALDAVWGVLPPLAPDLAMRYGLYDARGYDYPVERRYEQLWSRYIATDRGCYYASCGLSVAARRRALRVLGLFGVTDVLQDRRQKPLRTPGLRVAYTGPDGRIYKNPYALPRAFMVDRQWVVRRDSSARASIGSRTFDGRLVAITDRHLAGLAQGSSSRDRPAGRARIAAYNADRVVVRTTSARNALLVLTDAYFPGWNATVDARAAPIHRVDYLLRGVSVPAGRHKVEFRYLPASWDAGRIVSGLTFLGLVVTALIAWRRAVKRRRRQPATRAAG
jgi:Bacterial membrane protein YfhO